ncbi:MAG: plastocyanin/azurin family copper-binding protein [Pseudomonadota bacterium]
MKRIIFAVCFALSAVMTYASQHHVVGQKDKMFSVDELTVSVGSTVEFRNEDPFFHNVYSLSDLKTFDLGSYPKGESRAVTFDQPGDVEIECAIHPSMIMTVHVTE